MAETIRIEGLQETLQALRQVDKAAPREIRKEYRRVGQVVARAAKSVAASKGLRDSGALIGGIRPSVRGSTLYVQDLVRRDGFPYPQVYEGMIAGHGDRRGARAFLEPALDQSTGQVMDAFDDMLDRLAASSGF